MLQLLLLEHVSLVGFVQNKPNNPTGHSLRLCLSQSITRLSYHTKARTLIQAAYAKHPCERITHTSEPICVQSVPSMLSRIWHRFTQMHSDAPRTFFSIICAPSVKITVHLWLITETLRHTCQPAPRVLEKRLICLHPRSRVLRGSRPYAVPGRGEVLGEGKPSLRSRGSPLS